MSYKEFVDAHVEIREGHQDLRRRKEDSTADAKRCKTELERLFDDEGKEAVLVESEDSCHYLRRKVFKGKRVLKEDDVHRAIRDVEMPERAEDLGAAIVEALQKEATTHTERFVVDKAPQQAARRGVAAEPPADPRAFSEAVDKFCASAERKKEDQMRFREMLKRAKEQVKELTGGIAVDMEQKQFDDVPVTHSGKRWVLRRRTTTRRKRAKFEEAVEKALSDVFQTTGLGAFADRRSEFAAALHQRMVLVSREQTVSLVKDRSSS